MTKVDEANNQPAGASSKIVADAAATADTKDVAIKSNNADNRPVKPPVVIRLMTPDDIPQCLDIFKEHELPEASYALYTYRTLDPNGAWVAQHAETGQVLAMCFGSKFIEDCATIGFYGVKKGYQGCGLGVDVWAKVIDYIGKDNNMGLCSSPTQIKIYKEKAGFIVEDKFRMMEYVASSCTLNHITPSDEDRSVFQIIPVSSDTLDSVIQYDRQLIGRDRSRVLSLSLFEPTCIAFVAVDVKDKQKVLGYGAIKMSSYDVPMIQPMYADSYDISKVLLYNLIMNCPIALEKGAITFTLDASTDARKLFELTGFKETLRVPRLFTKHALTIDQPDKVYSLISPDFYLY